ncbi:MAG: acetate--CoA ligase family protein [Syntrophales bacterium]|nr:acetate--CoA ligase family protein [Syntrophales bacterium]
MKAVELIERAKSEGRTALNEAEAKQLLKCYGVPVVEETVVETLDDTVAQARITGFPVVLKGLGSRLTHKTERGLVRLNLKDTDDVRSAAREILDAAGDDLEGFLIQPMLLGRREFVAGLFRDVQFGPVVMFGLGGVFTEALDDVVFRLAPLNEVHAAYMLDELRAAPLLGPFRGERAVEREQIVQTLLGLSRLGLDYPEVTEVDVNPLLISPDGKVRAVDALVILGEKTGTKTVYPPVGARAMRDLFYPNSIAIVGASPRFGKWGHRIFTNIAGGDFKGELYLVNAKGGKIAGRHVFKSVTEIPGQVDLAIVMIPADRVLELIPQLKVKGIKSMLVITSGFSETGEQGRHLEEQLVREAREAGILVLGPNTMGICNPHYSLYATGAHVRPKPGSMALVTQSGNLGVQLLAFAEREGIGIRAFCGSGNETMVTIEDCMDAFDVDDLTRTVVLYIESIKDGRRFFETACRVGLQKPVVVLKGGRTRAGEQAAASHTGALASDLKVFGAACRQAGIVLVEQPMDLLDLAAAFTSLPLLKSKRVAIVTMGGGWGVVTADLCVEYGLEVPDLSSEIISQINQILPPYWSHSNPIDLVGERDPKIPIMVIEELLKWDGCDALIYMGILGHVFFVRWQVNSMRIVEQDYDLAALENLPRQQARVERSLIEHVVRMMEKYEKPVVGVSMISDETSRTITDIEGSPYKGVSFLTPERAVKALAKMYTYGCWRNGEGVLHGE